MFEFLEGNLLVVYLSDGKEVSILFYLVGLKI